MKFFGLNNQIVWDAEKNKELCQFKNGELETNDVEVIDKLKAYDYKSEPEPEPLPETKPVKGGKK